MTASALRLALDALPFQPLTRPAMPAVDVLDPLMKRTAWLDRARLEHNLLWLSCKALEVYDFEFPHIFAECAAGFLEMERQLAAAQAHHQQALGLIVAIRARIAEAGHGH